MSFRSWIGCSLLAMAGCRSAEVSESVPSSAMSTPNDSHLVQHQAASPPQEFTIVFTTFIPANHVLAPRLHPQSYVGPIVPHRIVFSGDDRSFDVDATRFRSRQIVTLVPARLDAGGGVHVVAKQNLGGVTESFPAEHVLADGRITDEDRTMIHSLDYRRSVAVSTEGMLIDDPIRLGPNKVSVRLHTAKSGGPRDQLIAGAPSIDWDLTVTLDDEGLETKYEVNGEWDGYPACELYVNRQPVFQSSPGEAAPSPVDLLKLLPNYGDRTIRVSGTLPH